MEIKNNNHNDLWLNMDIDLGKAFCEESFEKLIKYSNENELNLMHIWLNRDKNQIRKALELGNLLLSYFEHNSMAENSKDMAAFKLGELYGYIKCLGRISYEHNTDNFVKVMFEKTKSMNPKYSNHLENVITAFSNERGTITKKELLENLPFDLQELEDTLTILLESGFIFYYGSMIRYSLTDIGIRLINQLSETIKK